MLYVLNLLTGRHTVLLVLFSAGLMYIDSGIRCQNGLIESQKWVVPRMTHLGEVVVTDQPGAFSKV